MQPFWESLPRPFIIAHRGASRYAPENTLAAFRLAAAQGADAVELDAKLSRDGHIVVMHDNTVDRTTNGSGAVREMDWDALQRLSAGGEEGDPETAIPLLENVLEAVAHDVLVNIELTNYAAPLDDLPYLVADLITRLNLQERVWISSFNPWVLRRFAKRMPDVPIGFLIDDRYPWMYPLWRRFVPHQLTEPHLSLVNESAVRRWHVQGKLVAVYTVNDADDMRRLFAWGVDAIFTDDTPLAQRVREEFRAHSRG